MPSLTKDLDIPCIGGRLDVKAKQELNERGETASWNLTWELDFWASGPDARFMAASATVPADRFPRLLEMFQKGIDQVKVLQNADFDGDFSEFYSCGGFPMLGVSASNGEVKVKFWLQNPRKKLFSLPVLVDKLEEITAQLVTVPIHAEKLMGSLRILVSGK